MLEAIFAIGAFIVIRVADVLLRETVKSWVTQKQENHTPADSGIRDTKSVVNDLETIDAEIVETQRRVQFDGFQSQRDTDRLEELEFEREQKFQEYQTSKETEIIQDQATNANDYAASEINTDHLHVLQYHMSQVVLEKKCVLCGRPMILQSRTRLDGSLYQLSDFFWSCVGYYNPANMQCRGKQNYRSADASLLHKSNIYEFQVSNSELSLIFNTPSITQTVITRVRDHVREKDTEILCPVHHIPMVLRQKREPQGALDMFFLTCPSPHCQQMSKLKSPAQLAAYLQRREGRGIL